MNFTSGWGIIVALYFHFWLDETETKREYEDRRGTSLMWHVEKYFSVFRGYMPEIKRNKSKKIYQIGCYLLNITLSVKHIKGCMKLGHTEPIYMPQW